MTDSQSFPSCFIIMPLTTPAQYVEAYKGDADHFIHVLNHLFIPVIEAAGMVECECEASRGEPSKKVAN